jgi:hypothetical protein
MRGDMDPYASSPWRSSKATFTRLLAAQRAWVRRHAAATRAACTRGHVAFGSRAVCPGETNGATHMATNPALPDRSVDELRSLRPVLRVDVGFGGDAELRGSVGVLAEDRLTPDDDDLVVVRDVCRGPDDVLQVAALHRLACSRTCRQIAQRSRGPTTPANGVACRRARASSVSDVVPSLPS